MANKKKPVITYVPGGFQTWQDYKKSMNTLSVRMTGTPIERSDEEWKKAFEKFRKKALENKSKTE